MNATQIPLFAEVPTSLVSQYGHTLPVLPYAGVPPSVDRDTSKAAAEAIGPKVGNLQCRVLLALYSQPGLSDEGLDRVLGLTKPCRPRRRELEIAGFVRDSGQRSQGSSGLLMTCWELTKAGEIKARELLTAPLTARTAPNGHGKP